MKSLILLLFAPTFCCAQYAQFDQILKSPDTTYYNVKGATIIYPIVRTGNTYFDNTINTTIKDTLFSWITDSLNKPANVLLDTDIKNGLTYVNYEVTFNDKGILSFNVALEDDGGAHPTTAHFYFNFNLQSGKQLLIGDIINATSLSDFKAEVLENKKDSLIKYKDVDLKEMRKEDTTFSQGYYDVLVENADSCMKSVSLENFILTDSTIEIVDDCEGWFRQDASMPYYRLIYQYNVIKRFLNKNFRK